ncbi:LETM1-like protein [Tenacibaculum skagerrakense]|uniref:LETM1-like protein n=1 Tax=Tenacibaculum skagerrakense TaxID=186571 RepID=A0A4R2NTF5_9FLAO|nr:LETM1 domain-containing protein [Tenacibaculum skagerrakense]TCP24738.1 LETM1-like protein [Tenacibaculum skagerrakense]
MNSVEEIKSLLQRNKARLLEELAESKELVFLLKKSITTTLTEEEKAKVKEQTLDICKGIPAFAVFMLPGGALLLPLLIKLIPTILPSSFRKDNSEKFNNPE